MLWHSLERGFETNPSDVHCTSIGHIGWRESFGRMDENDKFNPAAVFLCSPHDRDVRRGLFVLTLTWTGFGSRTFSHVEMYGGVQVNHISGGPLRTPKFSERLPTTVRHKSLPRWDQSVEFPSLIGRRREGNYPDSHCDRSIHSWLCVIQAPFPLSSWEFQENPILCE